MTGRVSCVGAAANISDAFTVRDEREGRDPDPVTAEALASGRPAYNLALMSAEEWLDSPVYRTAYTVIQHVKRVYRKLDVDSRVTLARALLRPPAPAVRPR